MFDFPTAVESLDAVPEAYRPLYREGDSGFALDEGLAKRLDVSGLVSALEKERRAARDSERQLKAWSALGRSPAEVEALLQPRAEPRSDNPELGRMRSALERHLVDAAATAEIAAARGVPALLLPHVRAAAKVVEEGGDYVVRVVDAQGEPRVNQRGEYLSLSDLVGEMRQAAAFARAFEGSGTTGSGTPPRSGAGHAPGTFTLTRDEARDPVVYRRVRAEAEKAGRLPTIID